MATTMVSSGPEATRPPTRPPLWSRLLRALGVLLIGAGVVILLFIVYLLYWTDRETAVEQAALTREWQESILPEVGVDIRDGGRLDVGDLPSATDFGPGEDDNGVEVPVDPGDAYALLWFERDGELVVADRITAVVEGVTVDHLTRGPGHYPESAAPGGAGTFGVAGHRTTYGRPFHHLDQLRTGDEIHVLDRQGRHWVYDLVEVRPVDPTDVWVVDPDPLDRGITHGITLTTCHPKYSAAQRLVAFGELRGGQVDDDRDAAGDTGEGQ